MGRRRAVGLVRVSEVGEREGDSFASPEVQEDRLRATCAREQLDLTRIFSEMNVSGGLTLEQRTGLGPAVAAIEAGEAEVLVGAYFDRLFRNLREQADVVKRIEAAGGEVLAVDFGRVTETGSAAQWLSGTMLGAVSEYFRRSAKERSAAAVQRAIDRGVPPWPWITPGYVRLEDGRFEPGPLAPVVADAVRLRAQPGVTLAAVQTFLRSNGFPGITLRRVQTTLKSRVLRGELHFGTHTPNLQAHEPIVTEEEWRLAQDAREPRGRRAKSERLLARLGVLRCGSCDGLMTINSIKNQYRCSSANEGCPRKTTINADLVDDAVGVVIKTILADVEGIASRVDQGRKVEDALEKAQAELDAAIRVLQVVGEEASAIERLLVLREARDALQAQAEPLRRSDAVRLPTAEEYDGLPIIRQRALIKANVREIRVGPGRGRDRLSFDLL